MEFPLELVAGFQAQTSAAEQIDGLKLAREFFSDPAKSIRSNVLFNATACEHIRKFRLYDKEVLEKRVAMFYKTPVDAPPEERDIPSFPAASIVTKAFWLTIDAAGSDITVWDSTDPTGAICRPACARMIEVRPANKGEACNLANLKNGPVLSSCFYNIPVTKENQGTFKSSITVEPGDVLVLVGLHIITKEIPDWVWSTFWWNPQANQGRFAADKFDQKIIKGVWRNYLMDTTFSMETPRESQQQRKSASLKTGCIQIGCTSTESPSAKICFNPYLEGNLPDRGQLSNCMNCHKQATFHGIVPDPRGLPRRGYLDSAASCFSPENMQLMRLDYLWSLAPLEDASLSEFLGTLQQDLFLRQQSRQPRRPAR
jgi:hypothetical protein